MISAAASYIPSKIGLSGVPRPCPTPGSWRALDRVEVRGVVHEGEQVDVGRGGLEHLEPVGGEDAEAVGQPHREVEPDRVQRMVATHRVAQQGVVPDDRDRVAHGASSLLLHPWAARAHTRGGRYPLASRPMSPDHPSG